MSGEERVAGRTRKLASLLAVVLMGVAVEGRPQTSLGPGDYEQSVQAGGRRRSYLLHLPPAYAGGRDLPLVVVLHGGGGRAQGMVEITNFSVKADNAGFVAAYPNGTGRFTKRFLTWNGGNCCAYAFKNNVDDVGFIGALIEKLEWELKIDSRRIFVTGFSNGAMMTYRLGCELSDKIAAIAPVAGAFNVEPCSPKQPLSVVIFHGTADQHVPYEGGTPKKRLDPTPRVDKPVSYAVLFWAHHDGCSNEAEKEVRGSVVREVYDHCSRQANVELYTIKGQRHAWPGGKKWAAWADAPSREISATDVMWDFFVDHPKP